MPAPLAKGLIISLSLLFAAGAAVYENPQVRQWVDESRRKVAIALHSLGDELAPQSQGREAARDASTREDESPEATERRRQARQEILERGRAMEERKRATRQAKGQGMSFDDLVDKDGALRRDEGTTAMTTAAESQVEEPGLRHRATESRAATLGSTVANPFADEVHFEHRDQREEHPSMDATLSRSPTPTALSSPPVPPKPAAYQPQRLLIDTDETSNHPSEQLVDLTPTTSASSAVDDLAELYQGDRQPSLDSYLSVNEWAQHQSAQSLPFSPMSENERSMQSKSEPSSDSLSDNAEHASQVGTEDMDVMSEFEEGINTPSTWTEVGSQYSED